MSFPSLALIAAFFATPAPSVAPPTVAPPGSWSVASQDPDAEFERRFEAAQGDIEALWKVYSYCQSYGLDTQGRKVARAVLKLDDEHVGAHEALGHTLFDGQWFTSEKKLEAYKKEKEEADAKAKGWVRYKGGWADPADVEKLEAGLVRLADGSWASAAEAEFIEKGWVRHDLLWIPPDEVEKEQQGLFKCGEEWKSLDDANRYHSLPARFWKIPSSSGRFHVYATTDRAIAEKALAEAEDVVGDLMRIFGREPAGPHVFALLRSTKQYGTFAAGDNAFGTPPTEVRGLSSIHGAYFAEVWFDEEAKDHLGAGVAYWDTKAEGGDEFGRLFARHAAALSFVEALDPSPKAMDKFKKSKRGEFDVDAFLEEKAIPDWLRYGAASYVERYYLDHVSGGDPERMKKWSIQMILRRGALDSLDRILAMNLSVDDPDGSGKLLNEAGLVLAFILDGGNLDLIAAHGAFKKAMQEGGDLKKPIKDLERALFAAEDAFRAFAQI